MNTYLTFLVLALCNGAIALTVTKGTIFRRLREWAMDRSDFFGELIQCPYCTAHWVAALALLFVPVPALVSSGNVVIDWIVTWFALVAGSAMSAGTIYKLFSSSES